MPNKYPTMVVITDQDTLDQFEDFHNYYTQVADTLGWPKPRKGDTLKRIFAQGLADARRELQTLSEG